MFKADYFLNAIALLILITFASLASATMVELWGGEGVNIQVYADNHAFLLFDCAKGHSNEWNYQNYPLTAIAGTIRSDENTMTYPSEIPTKFSAFLNSKNEMLLTVEVTGSAPITFTLHRSVKPTFHSCGDQ